jgi:putative ABC transport system permease protein
VVETLLADLRYAARRLRAEPGFTAITVLTVALGIGATTAIFGAVNPILFQPLPYPEAGRIMMIWDVGSDGSRVDLTFGTCRELAARSRSFEAIAAMKSWQPTIQGAGEPERLDGQRVSASYFHALGVPPVLGRDFHASDDRPGAPNVVIVRETCRRIRGSSAPPPGTTRSTSASMRQGSVEARSIAGMRSAWSKCFDSQARLRLNLGATARFCSLST